MISSMQVKEKSTLIEYEILEEDISSDDEDAH